MLDWFTDLFTLEHLGFFVLGVTAACTYHIVKAKFQRKVVIINWQYITIPLVVLLAAYMAVQNQQNANCVREFQQTLRERSAITSDNDRLSIEQRVLVYDWMHGLVFPPEDIAALPGSDPRREKYALDLTIATDKKFEASLEQQRENDARRAANPLPPPTCGL